MIMSAESEYAKKLLALVAEVCEACATECEKHAGTLEHCRQCAEICHKCAEECSKVKGPNKSESETDHATTSFAYEKQGNRMLLFGVSDGVGNQSLN
jgi:hypothetical protein